MTKIFTKKILTCVLAFVLALPFFAIGLHYLLKRSDSFDKLDTNAIYKTISFKDNVTKDMFSISSPNGLTVGLNDLNQGTLLDYTTSNTNLSQSSVKVNVTEKLRTSGQIQEFISVGDGIIGEVYFDDLNLSQVVYNGFETNYVLDDKNNVSQLYAQNKITDYQYNNGLVSKIKINNKVYNEICYNKFDKINSETFPELGLKYEYVNGFKNTYIYDKNTGNQFLYECVDLITVEPYQTTTQSIVVDGQSFEVITEIKHNDNTLALEYGYAYNGKAYPTKSTLNGEVRHYSYLNDKLIASTIGNETYTYVYTSFGKLVGVNVAYTSENVTEYNDLALEVDAFNNLIGVYYLRTSKTDTGEIVGKQMCVAEFAYNSFGDKISVGGNQNFPIGYNSGLSFDSLGLTICGADIYSSILGTTINSKDQILGREYNSINLQRQEITEDSYTKSLVTEKVQLELLNTKGVASTDEFGVFVDGNMVEVADIFTLPSAVVGDNIFKGENKLYKVVKASVYQEGEAQALSLSKDSDTQVACMGMYPAQVGTEDIRVQFIFNGDLYVATTTAEGVVEYTQYKSGTYTDANYIADKNLYNYDTERYVQYFESELDESNFAEQASLAYNLSGELELTEFFAEMGLIGSSGSETYRDVNFGDATDYANTLLTNTFAMQLPEYDPQIEYLEVQQDGTYAVKQIGDIVEEENNTNVSSSVLWTGIGHIINGVMMVAGGVALIAASVATCGTFSIVVGVVCGAVAIAAGATVTFCGVVMTSHYASNGNSWFVNEVLDGNLDILYTIANVAEIVGTVALVVGNITVSFANCFVAGTAIHTINGTKAIEDIKVGDTVLAYNEQTGQTEYSKVTQTFKKLTDTFTILNVGNSTITSTPEHPYFANGQYVKAEDLKIGDKLLLSDGTYDIVKNINTITGEERYVYNFEVSGLHNYFVDYGVLVHNVCKELLQDYMQNDVYNDDAFEIASDYIKSKYSIHEKNWDKVRRDFWQVFGKNCDSKKLGITNINDVAYLGKAPIINGQRIQLHHVFGKGKNMLKLVPMEPSMHTLYHKTYGYHWDDPILKWLKIK